MDEHEDLKKRAADESTAKDTGPPIRWMKSKTNGKIPDVVRDSKGHLYIVREYKDEMKGKVIPDEMVVRANNGRWFTHDEIENLKSTPRCPTYGVCDKFYGSGPVHMLCQKCAQRRDRDILS
jgi:hypothetical protein